MTLVIEWNIFIINSWCKLYPVSVQDWNHFIRPTDLSLIVLKVNDKKWFVEQVTNVLIIYSLCNSTILLTNILARNISSFRILFSHGYKNIMVFLPNNRCFFSCIFLPRLLSLRLYWKLFGYHKRWEHYFPNRIVNLYVKV